MPLAAIIPAVIGAVGGAASAAAIGSAALGVGTALYSANQAKKASKKALTAQELAAEKQLADQKDARDQITTLQQPYVQGGYSALDAILQRYNLSPSGGAPAPAQPGQPATSSKTPGGMSANYGTPGGVTSTAPSSGAAPQAPQPAGPAPGSPDWNAYSQANPDIRQYYDQTPEAQTVPFEAFLQQTAEAQKDIRGAPPTVAAPAGQDPAARAPYVPEYTRPDQGAWQGAGTAPKQSDFLDPSKFTTSPGYEFRLNEGNRNLNASYGAKGLLKSGSALKGVTDYGQGAASAEFGNWFNQQNTLYQEALGQYNADRSANYNIFTGERNNTNQNFADDRSYGTNLGLTNRTYDTNVAIDARNNAQGQDQVRISNLFNLVNNGRSAASATGNAASNYADNAGNIYGNTANAQGEAAYGTASANSQLGGAIGGALSSAANLFGGTPRVSPSNGSTLGNVNLGTFNPNNIFAPRAGVGVF